MEAAIQQYIALEQKRKSLYNEMQALSAEMKQMRVPMFDVMDQINQKHVISHDQRYRLSFSKKMMPHPYLSKKDICLFATEYITNLRTEIWTSISNMDNINDIMNRIQKHIDETNKDANLLTEHIWRRRPAKKVHHITVNPIDALVENGDDDQR